MQKAPEKQDAVLNALTASAFLRRNRFELLVHAIKDYGIYLLDLDGHIVSWNAGAERFKGYRAEEIIGRHFSCLYTPEDCAAGVPQRALATAAEHGTYEAESMHVRKDGSRFLASIVIDPVLDESGTLIGYAKVTRDLTEKKAAEQALFESEQRFRLLVQGVRDYAIYMLDPDGYITDWNSGAVVIKGYASHEIIGRHFSCFYTPEDRERGEPERELAVALRMNTFQNEGWRIRKDGTRFWASIVIDPIYNETGKLLGFAKVTRDITERKSAQDEIDRQRDILSHAKKLEAIGRITGGVAHDFNNLLTVIRSAADLLGAVSLPEKRSRYVEIISETAGRAAQLTQQLLAFAREQPLHPEVFNVGARIQALTQLIEMTVSAKIKVNVDIPEDLKNVHADASQFETAVLNLVINSRDAMPAGGALQITARNASNLPSMRGLHDPAGTQENFVAVSIGDTGCGIELSIIEQIFEPFFTTKELNKGTGLGLSQVYGFAKQSGGEVTVESHVGDGTTFTLFLPCAKEEHSASCAAPTPDALKKVRPSNVLLVEDNEMVGEFTRSVLSDVGHSVTWVVDGEAALKTLEAQHGNFDLVISDVMMPGMSGIELGKEIRRRWPALRVVLSSGYSATLAQEGSHGFELLQKPYTLERLLAVIR